LDAGFEPATNGFTAHCSPTELNQDRQRNNKLLCIYIIMSNKIIIKITLSISGHGKMVEPGEGPLTFKPERNEEIWILGAKNAGILSLSCPTVEHLINDVLGKYDLEQYHQLYVDYLNKQNQILSESIPKMKFTDESQRHRGLIQNEYNVWSYNKQTNKIGNKIFGGEPDPSRTRAVPVLENGPTVVIHAIDIIGNFIYNGRKKISFYYEHPVRLDTIIYNIKEGLSTILAEEFKDNLFFNITSILSKNISYNFQIYDETCNFTNLPPVIPRFDSQEKVSGRLYKGGRKRRKTKRNRKTQKRIHRRRKT